MKRIAGVLWLVLLICFVLVACDNDPTGGDTDASADADAEDSGMDGDVSDGDPDTENPDADDAGLGENDPPDARFTASPDVGVAPLEVTFDASESVDEDGEIALYAWDFGDDSEAAQGQIVSHTFESAGCFDVVLTVVDDRGGVDTFRSIVVVTATIPTGEPELTLEGLPAASAFIPRDIELNQGAVTISGTVSSPGYHSVQVVVSRGDGIEGTYSTRLCSLASPDIFEVTAQVPAELASHTLEIYLASSLGEASVATVEDVVAGDVYLVQGQSNAVARQFVGDANINQGPFLRSFGSRAEHPGTVAADLEWHGAEGNAAGGPGAVGQWSIRLGRQLIEAHDVPVAIINGARGGQPITYFRRNEEDRSDLVTNYGRLLVRSREAGVSHAVRALLFYQGESDGANAEGHRDGLATLIGNWQEDFPSLERIYVVQVRLGCGGPTPQLRDAQRRLADDFEIVSVMSPTGIDGHDGCHYAYENGYELLAARFARMLGRDLYDGEDLPDIDSPNPDRIYWSSDDGTELTIALRDSGSTMTWDAGAERDFILEGALMPIPVSEGRVEGSNIILTLSSDGRAAGGLTYQGHSGPGAWVRNANGVGLLAFHNLPIVSP